MDNLTCVIDATTLVDKIQEIKQWICDDAIHVHVPLSTIEKVEQLYNATLTPKDGLKDSAKDASSKKLPTKSSRKEIPLFDINPRITREFLLRVRGDGQSEGGSNQRVSFQLPQEQFTQWKEEEQQAIKADQPPEGPPTSFAQALLRKLNFSDGTDDSGTKGPSKPKLVAKTSNPKSPWKYHKVPNIASTSVLPSLKPLFSCLLWRLHEFENNPLMPETFLLLSNDFDIRQQAQKLNVPARSITEMRQLVRQRISVMDDRASQGELERDFPMKKLRKNGTVNGDSHTVLRESASTNGYELGVDALLATVEDNKNLKTNITEERGTIGILDILNVKPKEIVSPVEVPVAYNVSAPLSRTPPLEISYAKETTDKLDDNPSTPLDVVGVLTDKTISTIHEPALAIKVIQDNEKVQEPVPILLPLPEDKKASPPEVKEDSDSDDEEMIVFKPKSRPSSGLPKVTVESSRPKTADSTKKIPNTAAIDKSIKTRIPTQLKPQSPVFVPRNLASPIVVPSQLRHQAPGTAPGPSVPTAPVQATAPTMAKLQTASVVQTQSTRQVHDPAQPPTHHHTRVHKPQQIRSEGLVQRQGREIIERQREAINRQAQASPKVSPKPPPRQIQMQPTSSPTVIDPDAFDRSYVVQPRNPNASNGTNGNHREDSGRGSPRRERVPKTPEPDLDYILKSGAPRGSTRGRGKLWVP